MPTLRQNLITPLIAATALLSARSSVAAPTTTETERPTQAEVISPLTQPTAAESTTQLNLPTLNPSNPSETQLTPEAAPSCGSGEFASAFPDVKPTDWAYEAVNRLADRPIRCFPIQG